MSQGDFRCQLSNGRTVQLWTHEGSDEYEFLTFNGFLMLLQDGKTPEVLAAYVSLQEAQGMQKKREFTVTLFTQYYLMWVVAQMCFP